MIAQCIERAKRLTIEKNRYRKVGMCQDKKENNLTALFSELTVEQAEHAVLPNKSRRILVGYADTEGAPYRSRTSILWDMCVIFKYVVDDNFSKIENCFHTCHFSIDTTGSSVRALKNHFQAFDFIKKSLDCDDVCLCFWNASHDMSVLKCYDQRYPLLYVDLLSIARNVNSETNYSLNSLYKKKMNRHIEHRHTSLGDTLALIELLNPLNLNDTIIYKKYVKSVQNNRG